MAHCTTEPGHPLQGRLDSSSPCSERSHFAPVTSLAKGPPRVRSSLLVLGRTQDVDVVCSQAHTAARMPPCPSPQHYSTGKDVELRAAGTVVSAHSRKAALSTDTPCSWQSTAKPSHITLVFLHPAAQSHSPTSRPQVGLRENRDEIPLQVLMAAGQLLHSTDHPQGDWVWPIPSQIQTHWTVGFQTLAVKKAAFNSRQHGRGCRSIGKN